MNYFKKTVWCALLFTLSRTDTVAQTPAGVEPETLQGVGIEQKLDELLPLDLTFLNEAGEGVKIGDYFGDRPVVLSFVYYECPMLCTMILNGLLKAINVMNFKVGKEFDIITVSFDHGETPQMAATKKRTYLLQYQGGNPEDSWHFLTGSKENVRRLADAVGFNYKYSPETDQYVHASGIMVVTPEGRVSKYFYGIEYSPRDLKLGLMEAADRKIGSPVDQILLYCYHYDPTTGKYGVVIMNVIRLLGSITVIALVTFIFLMLRRDRRTKKQMQTV